MKEKRLFVFAAALAAIVPALCSLSAKAAISDIYGDPTTTGSQAGSYSEIGTVTSILNSTASVNTFTVQDSTGSVLLYAISKTAYTATVGDTLAFTATNSPYQGAPELINTGFTDTASAPGVAPAANDLTIPEFNSSGQEANTPAEPNATPPYAESVVELDNVSFQAAPSSIATNTSYTLVDGSGNTTKFYGYKSDSAVLAAVNAANTANPLGFGGTYDIVGYADEYYGAAEIYPLSIVAVPEPASLGLLAIGGIALLARRRSAH